MTEDMIPCPTCRGEQAIHLVGCGTDGCRPVSMRCYRCDSQGIVPREAEQWIADGKRLRDRRVHGTPYRNLRDEAARLGLDVIRLSRLEQGVLPGAAALLQVAR